MYNYPFHKKVRPKYLRTANTHGFHFIFAWNNAL
jgi:hypothetical protein